MDLQLHGKSVFISGSTAGIGFAIAKAFAEEGAKVHLNGRSKDKVEGAIERIKKQVKGAKVNGIVADGATAEGFEKIAAELPEVDILVNNLGAYGPVDFFESKDEDWTDLFNTNVMSGVRLTRHFMPAMIKKNWGRVIFISSESAFQVPTEMIHYGMTKTAQLSLVSGLAPLTKGTGVTVNSVLPGPTFSEGVASFISDLAKQNGKSSTQVEEEFFAETRPLSLLQRFITPDEVAAAVVFVASPKAAATNGAAVRADGGILRGLQ